MYRNGHPNRLAALLNRGWAWVARTGLGPKRLVALEVRGHRIGCSVSCPVVIADLEGERYLVSMLGERARWVRNVRAAGGRAVLHRGRREPVQLEEVEPAARAAILQRYLQVAPAARSFIPVDRHGSLSEFERIASGYPTFRIVTRSE
jgi:hypothetical protein